MAEAIEVTLALGSGELHDVLVSTVIELESTFLSFCFIKGKARDIKWTLVLTLTSIV
jgi:hypothetical protein